MRSWSLALPFACLLAGGVLGAQAQAQQSGQQPAPWPAERFNPRPAEGDVMLPLPCGGQMAFRRTAAAA